MCRKLLLIVLITTAIILQGAILWADMVVEMDNADSSATQFGAAGGCFDSTFRILYQGDNYAACRGTGGPETAGYFFDMRNAPRVTGGQFVYENSGEHCIYVKYADGAARATNALYQVDWNSPGIAGFVPNQAFTVNQTLNGGQWVRLGCSTAPTAGQAAVVKCSNAGVAANRYTICDGIKITRENVDGGDIVDGTVSSSDILNSTITSTDIASQSVVSGDLQNEPGIEYALAGSRTIGSLPVVGSCSTLTSVTVTAPSSGYVHVQASGIGKITQPQRYVRPIMNTGGCGFVGIAPILERQYTEGGFADERRFHIQNVFTINAGQTVTYYLRAYREDATTTGTIFWNALTATFYPTRY